VVFEKLDSPIYTLTVNKSSQKFDKAGRGPTPIDVAAVLNMSPLDIDGLMVNLNFADQLSEPLLMKLTEFQLYKVVVKSLDGEKIQEAIALCKKDTDDKATELKKKEDEVVIQKRTKLQVIDRLSLFDDLVGLREEFDNYDRSCRILPNIIELNARYQSIDKKEDQAIRMLDIYSGAENLMKNYEIVQGMIKKLNYLQEIQNTFDALDKNISDIATKLSGLKGLDELNAQTAIYTLNTGKLRLAIDYNNEMLNVEKEIDWVDSKISFLGSDFTDLGLEVVKYTETINKLAILVDLQKTGDKIASELVQLEQNISGVSGLPDATEYRKTCETLNFLITQEEKRISIEQQIKTADEQLVALGEEVVKVQYMIDNKVCPTCGKEGCTEILDDSNTLK
jgi:hypothetical protein